MRGLLHIPYYHQPDALPDAMQADLRAAEHPADAELVLVDWRERHYVDPRLCEFLWEHVTGRRPDVTPEYPTCATCAFLWDTEVAGVHCHYYNVKPFGECPRWKKKDP